jgi:aminopeptidase N
MQHPHQIFRRSSLAALLMAALSGGAQAEAPFSFNATPGKLPKNIVPLEYSLHIVPNLNARSFRGEESVELEVRSTASEIVLNALRLEVESAVLTGKDGKPQALQSTVDEKNQTLSLKPEQPLAPGRYQLRLAYRGKINRESTGLFEVKYHNEAGDKVLLSTQMEPASARELLPSWDEPVFRARFKLSVDLPASFSAYSNMPIKLDQPLDKERHRVEFAQTPKMSSYLLVLTAGEMERSSTQQDGVEIGVVTTAGKQGAAPFALAASKELLHYYNDYFGQRYPLPKLDQIAIPGSLGGAMENWGGIVYNETTLLYDANKSADTTRKLVFEVVAHEMAHQWFGNLVTTAWWDNLWLNEGFASWMATKAIGRFHPEWEAWQYASTERERAMVLDARKTTHPIQQPVASESEANEAFDAITYSKGEAFLRMLEAYLGEDAFRAGIRDYMQKHQYSNTTTADLWTALSKASGKPVGKIAADWTEQPGFPVIQVESRCEAGKSGEAGERIVKLTQQQFKLDEADAGQRLWNIPVQLGTTSDSSKSPYSLLQHRTQEVSLRGCTGTLVLDPAAIGYYRVQYSPELQAQLTAHWSELGEAARFKLLGDTWALVQADRTQLTAYLSLLEQLGSKPEPAMWDRVLASLGALEYMSQGSAYQQQVRGFALRVLQPVLAQVGWEPVKGESQQMGELRARLILTLGTYGDEAVIAGARERFAKLRADRSSVPSSLWGAVSSIAGRYADQATYDALKSAAEKAQDTEEKYRYYRALTNAIDPALAKQTLEMSLQPELEPMLASQLLQGVAGSEHLDLAWQFAKQHADTLKKQLPPNFQSMIFAGIAQGATEERYAADLEAFMKVNFPPEAQRVTFKAAEAIRFRAKLKERLLPQLQKDAKLAAR